MSFSKRKAQEDIYPFTYGDTVRVISTGEIGKVDDVQGTLEIVKIEFAGGITVNYTWVEVENV